MNLDDLRAELDAHANNFDTHAPGRMAGIRAKIAQRRRRKAGATVAASVFAVGAIIGVPVVNQLSAGPEPAKGGHFPEKIDGDTKIAEAMGDKGDTTVTLEFTPEDTDFLLKIDCDDLAPKDIKGKAAQRDWYATYSVNGKRGETRCGPGYDGNGIGDLGGLASESRVRKHWARFHVEPGRPVKVTVFVIDGMVERRSTDRIRGRLGVAAYGMTGERRSIAGVAVPIEKTVGGETYTLARRATIEPVDAGDSAELSIPRMDGSTLLTYGAIGRYLTSSRGSVDGTDRLSVAEGVSTTQLPGGRPHAVRLRNGSDVRTTLVLAYYTPVESDDRDTDPRQLRIPDTTDARDPLVASDVGEPGETVFRTTFTPEDTNLALSYGCATLKGSRDEIVTSLYIQGKKVEWGEGCYGIDGELWLYDDPDKNRRGWLREHGVKEGEPFEVEVRAKRADGAVVSLDEVVLGAAIYERSAPRTDAGAFVLADCQRRGNTWYTLADYATVKVTDDDRRAELSVPGTDSGHAFMWVGRKGKGEAGMFDSLVDDRVRAHYAGTISTLERVNGDPHDLAVRANPRIRGGHLVIAYYVPEE